MSRRIEVRGTALATSELLLRARKRADNVMESLPYVPGSALRGALAARWLASREPDARFQQLFQSGRVRFEHAYPLAEDEPTVPAPFTLLACKLDGFHPGHFAGDVITRQGLQLCEAADHGPRPAALKRQRGFVTVPTNGEGRFVAHDHALVSRQRIGTMSDGSRRAAQQALFEERLVAAGSRFGVAIRGEAEDVEALLEGCQLPVGQPIPLSVGRARTVLGEVEVQLDEPQPAETTPPPATDTSRTLMFHSDTVLLDGYQRSITAVSHPEVLATEVLGCDAADVEVHEAAVRTTPAGGWDALHRTSKPVDTAIAAGSVVRFSAPEEAVARLVSAGGIGWRQAEGYGAVAIDSPVHGQVRWQAWPTRRGEPTSDRRQQIATAARDVAAELFKARVSRSAWQGIAQTVRDGGQPTVRQHHAEGQRSEERQATDRQSLSGRSGRAGEQQRDRRRRAVEQYDAACDTLQLASQHERVWLVDDVAAELALRGREAKLNKGEAR